MFRRLKAGGELVSKCSRRAFNSEPNTGCGKGVIRETQDGISTLFSAQAVSTIAAT
jgi:hypothetical protein